MFLIHYIKKYVTLLSSSDINLELQRCSHLHVCRIFYPAQLLIGLEYVVFELPYFQDDWKKIIQACLKIWASDHAMKLNAKNTMYPSLWRENFVFPTPVKPVTHIIGTFHMFNFLSYYFGDLEHR